MVAYDSRQQLRRNNKCSRTSFATLIVTLSRQLADFAQRTTPNVGRSGAREALEMTLLYDNAQPHITKSTLRIIEKVN
ncbi:hypothetical protein KIN20_030969 [Parelaphostrongylus tenuis]|uniref:Uncharacterized protein n=1 Tax=Parelaphostrongylus tenuis TaxID=148309 RepID=A0AAD5R658_PARTN|nr:hypothetical protein KIN20_030969 [Parelaphostrongylus tenuis]